MHQQSEPTYPPNRSVRHQAPPPGYLLIDNLVGDRRLLAPGHTLRLGRTAEMLVGEDDPYMHRYFLYLENPGTGWVLHNVGNFISARMFGHSGARFSPINVRPKTSVALLPGRLGLSFETALMRYEISLETEASGAIPNPGPIPDTNFTHGTFEPNAEQRKLLFALAAPLLEDPTAQPHHVVPSLEQITQTLGWESKKKTENKMLRIVEALARAGVAEFQRGPSQVQWRLQLAQYAADMIRAGQIQKPK